MKNFVAPCLFAAALMSQAFELSAQDFVQKPETLFYNNEIFLLNTYPIDQNAKLYYELKNAYKLKPQNEVIRGYIGRWSIEPKADDAGQEFIALNYLEYFYGNNQPDHASFVSAANIKGYDSPASWVTGVYEAVRQSTNEIGTFTFLSGRLLNTSFHIGDLVIEGQPLAQTQQQLNDFIHRNFSTVSGTMRLTAIYDAFVDEVTPSDVTLIVHETSGDLANPATREPIERAIRNYLFSNKSMPLCSKLLRTTGLVNEEPKYKLSTYDNTFELALTGKPAEKPKSQATVASGTKHTVKSGETLGSIARKYKTSIKALLRLNPKIKDPDKLQIGQKIVVK